MHVYKPTMSPQNASNWMHALEASTGRQQLLTTQLERSSASKRLLITEGSTVQLMLMLQPQKLRGMFGMRMSMCACMRACIRLAETFWPRIPFLWCNRYTRYVETHAAALIEAG